MRWGYENENTAGLVFLAGKTNRIWGHGRFYYNERGTVPTMFCSLTDGSTIVFEFEYIYAKQQSFFTAQGATGYQYIKGYEIVLDNYDLLNNGVMSWSGSGIDSDGFSNLYFDVVKIRLGNEFLSGFFGEEVIQNLTLLNCYIESLGTTSGIINGALSFVDTFANIILAGVVIKNSINRPGDIYSVGSSTDANLFFKIFNCMVYSVGNDSTFGIQVGGIGAIDVSIYGISYFNRSYDVAGVTVTGTYQLTEFSL